jgi:hypothetical protein
MTQQKAGTGSAPVPNPTGMVATIPFLAPAASASHPVRGLLSPWARATRPRFGTGARVLLMSDSATWVAVGLAIGAASLALVAALVVLLVVVRARRSSCAARLHSVVRSADIACRVGGDEFAVILPESDLSDAEQLYRRVQFAVGARPIGPFERLHLSAGIAQLRQDDDAMSFFERADEALLPGEGSRQGLVHGRRRSRLAARPT